MSLLDNLLRIFLELCMRRQALAIELVNSNIVWLVSRTLGNIAPSLLYSSDGIYKRAIHIELCYRVKK